MSAADQVAKLFADVAMVPLEDVNGGTRLRELDDVDSLDLAEFFMSTEEEFGIELPDYVCIDLVTIDDVVAAVEKRRSPA